MKDDRLNLYKSLFKGREDVFALRWEKGNKSGYMPAYGTFPQVIFSNRGEVCRDLFG
jgi:hypothetical protein